MNILKQLEVSDIGSKTSSRMRQTKWRLTLVYTVVIIFVIGVLNISIYELFSQRFSQNIFSRIETESHENLSKEELSRVASEELFETMIMIDIILFVLVFALSFYLSRQALRPIDNAYQEQKKFLGNVAHELRTPLTVMKTGLEAYSLSEKNNNSDIIGQSIAEIDHMSNILNDLIFLVKNETVAGYSHGDISLSEILESEMGKILSYAQSKNVNISSDIHSSKLISANPTEIRQLIKNLLKNAIDYNRPGGTVTGAISETSNHVTLSIKDTGIGIDEADIPKVFDRFFRADSSRSNDTNSTGLGLAIVKSIAEKYRAQISIESKKGVGTTVSVTFKTA